MYLYLLYISQILIRKQSLFYDKIVFSCFFEKEPKSFNFTYVSIISWGLSFLFIPLRDHLFSSFNTLERIALLLIILLFTQAVDPHAIVWTCTYKLFWIYGYLCFYTYLINYVFILFIFVFCPIYFGYRPPANFICCLPNRCFPIYHFFVPLIRRLLWLNNDD